MNATKTFKIGEYAVGGIIRVEIRGKTLLISNLDWDTNEIVMAGGFTLETMNAEYVCRNYLQEATSSYWTDTIMKWIKSKIQFKNEFFY